MAIHIDDVTTICKKILDTKNKTEICFSFIQHLKDFSVFNKQEMNEQMKLWKDLAKQGHIQLYPENNNEYNINKKTLYLLVITPNNQDCSICPLSLALGQLVTGYTYVFTKKENRDAIYNYVKKYCVKEEEEKDE